MKSSSIGRVDLRFRRRRLLVPFRRALNVSPAAGASWSSSSASASSTSASSSSSWSSIASSSSSGGFATPDVPNGGGSTSGGGMSGGGMSTEAVGSSGSDEGSGRKCGASSTSRSASASGSGRGRADRAGPHRSPAEATPRDARRAARTVRSSARRAVHRECRVDRGLVDGHRRRIDLDRRHEPPGRRTIFVDRRFGDGRLRERRLERTAAPARRLGEWRRLGGGGSVTGRLLVGVSTGPGRNSRTAGQGSSEVGQHAGELGACFLDRGDRLGAALGEHGLLPVAELAGLLDAEVQLRLQPLDDVERAARFGSPRPRPSRSAGHRAASAARAAAADPAGDRPLATGPAPGPTPTAAGQPATPAGADGTHEAGAVVGRRRCPRLGLRARHSARGPGSGATGASSGCGRRARLRRGPSAAARLAGSGGGMTGMRAGDRRGERRGQRLGQRIVVVLVVTRLRRRRERGTARPGVRTQRVRSARP